MTPKHHLDFMRKALTEAEAAFERGEVPVGAVLVTGDGMVFRRSNRTRETGRPWAHAEYLAVDDACRATGDWRLAGSTLYTTLEPCVMCAGLILLARIPLVVYGAWDKRFGAFGSVADLLRMPGLNHYPEVTGGVLADESSRLLKRFFRNHRGQERSSTC